MKTSSKTSLKKENTGGQTKTKRIRTTDDLELLRIILEENSQLKAQVLKVLNDALGKTPGK